MVDVTGIISAGGKAFNSGFTAGLNLWGYDNVRDPLYGTSLANAGEIYSGQVGKTSGFTTGMSNAVNYSDVYRKINRTGKIMQIGAEVSGGIGGVGSSVGGIIEQASADKKSKNKQQEELRDKTFNLESNNFLSDPKNNPQANLPGSASFDETEITVKDSLMGPQQPESELKIDKPEIDLTGTSDTDVAATFLGGLGAAPSGTKTAKVQGGEYVVMFDDRGNVSDYTKIIGDQHTGPTEGMNVEVGKIKDGRAAILTRDQVFSLLNDPSKTKEVLDSIPLAGTGTTGYWPSRTFGTSASLQEFYDRSRRGDVNIAVPDINVNRDVEKLIATDLSKDLGLPAIKKKPVAGLSQNMVNLTDEFQNNAEFVKSGKNVFPTMMEKYKEYEDELKRDKYTGAIASGVNSAFAIGDIIANRFERLPRLDRMPVNLIPHMAPRFMPKDYSEIEKLSASAIKRAQEMGLSPGEYTGLIANAINGARGYSKDVDVINQQIISDVGRVNAGISTQNVSNRLNADLTTAQMNENRFHQERKEAMMAKENQREASMQLATGPLEASLWQERMKDMRTRDLQNYYLWFNNMKTGAAARAVGQTDPQ